MKKDPCPIGQNPAAPSVFPSNTARDMAPVRQPCRLPHPQPSAGTWDANDSGTWSYDSEPWQIRVTSSSAVTGQITFL